MVTQNFIAPATLVQSPPSHEPPSPHSLLFLLPGVRSDEPPRIKGIKREHLINKLKRMFFCVHRVCYSLYSFQALIALPAKFLATVALLIWSCKRIASGKSTSVPWILPLFDLFGRSIARCRVESWYFLRKMKILCYPIRPHPPNLKTRTLW